MYDWRDLRFRVSRSPKFPKKLGWGWHGDVVIRDEDTEGKGKSRKLPGSLRERFSSLEGRLVGGIRIRRGRKISEERESKTEEGSADADEGGSTKGEKLIKGIIKF